METLLSSTWVIISLVIILPVAFIWCFCKFLEACFNVIAIKKALKHPDSYCIDNSGFVINKKTKEVEASNKIKTPF